MNPSGYWIRWDGVNWIKVTLAEWIEWEQACGFHGPPGRAATSGFEAGSVKGQTWDPNEQSPGQ